MNEKWRVLLISVLTPSGVITAVSLFVIWGYFSRLNRLDVFFEVMNIQSIFALIFCAVILSLLFLLSIFFVSSVFMAVVIPQDVNNLPGYDKMKTNFLSVLMIAGLFPTTFIYTGPQSGRKRQFCMDIYVWYRADDGCSIRPDKQKASGEGSVEQKG